MKTYFKHGSITCPASYCHIACTSFAYFHGNNYDIASVNTCEQLQVYALSPLTTLYMYCGGIHGSMIKGDVSACNSTVIHADTAKSVTLLCGGGDYANNAIQGGGCSNLTLYAGNVHNNVTISCGQLNGCLNAYFDASNIGNSLNVGCDYAGCSGADIYGPKDALTNLHCRDGSACFGTQFHTTSESISENPWNLVLDPWNSRSSGAEVVCDDTHLTTTFMKNNTIWGCSNFDCCPFGLGSIVCSAGVPCQIDDANILAPYSHVDATQATSLTLDCTNGCQGTRIECPTGADTSCNIRCPSSYSCQYAYVQTGTNTLNQFALYCSGEYGCKHMHLQLDSSEITKFDLNCSATRSCYDLYTSLSSVTPVIRYLNIDCSASDSCYTTHISGRITSNARIDCVAAPKSACVWMHVDLIPLSSNVNIDIRCDGCNETIFHVYGLNNDVKQRNNISLVCGGGYGCRQSVLNASNLYRIDIHCNSSSACEKTEIYAANSDQLSMECSRENGCLSASINASNITQLSVKCSGDNGCSSASINTSNVTQLSVECSGKNSCLSASINTSKTTQLSVECSGDYGCSSASINTSKTTQLSVDCSGHNGCSSASINALNSSQLSVDCSGDNGCPSASINALNSSQLLVGCSGNDACQSVSIGCPSDGLCDIDCEGLDACSGMTTNITSETYNKLNFNCNGPANGCHNTDSSPRIYCIDSTAQGKLIWSTYSNQAVCYGDCCPLQPTIDTTSDLSNDPTIDATLHPTYHPTTNSTTHPTNDPTTDPITDTSLAANAEPKASSPSIAVIVIIAVFLFIVVLGLVYCRILRNRIKELQNKDSISVNLIVGNRELELLSGETIGIDEGIEGNQSDANVNQAPVGEDQAVQKALL